MNRIEDLRWRKREEVDEIDNNRDRERKKAPSIR